MPPALARIRNRRPAAWAVCLAVAPVFVALYYWVHSLGPGLGSVQVLLYCSANLSGALGSLVAARRRRNLRMPMNLLAAGALACVASDATIQILYVTRGAPPYPSVADAFALSSFPLMAAGFLVMIRRRTPEWDTASVIDAAIVAVSATFLGFIFLIVPTMTGTDVSLEQVVSVAYPAGDLILVAAGARLMLGAGPRPAALRLYGLYLAAILGADAVYGVQILDGTFVANGPLNAVWMLSGFALGAAALHPSAVRLVEPSPTGTPDAGRGRLAVLTAAVALAPTSLLIQQHRHQPLHLVVTVVACNVLFILVIARMSGLVRAQRLAATTDGLTGLRNRRAFEQELGARADRSRRTGSALGVLLLDIDHFKDVNDTYGHRGGDLVLIEVANRLRELVRSGDLVARYGGEEFVVVLPGAGPADTLAVAEHVRRGIARSPMYAGDGRRHVVTVSVGTCNITDECSGSEQLLLLADRALYAAKAAGRNRIAVSPQVLAPAAAATV